MTTVKQTHPINGSKPHQFGGDVSNIRILYRHHKKILSAFFVLIAFLLSFSESKLLSQTTNNCLSITDLLICEQFSWIEYTDYVILSSGCKVEVDYKLLRCTKDGKPFYKMELLGWRLLNSPQCSTLYQSIMPNGQINLFQVKTMEYEIYKKIVDKLFKLTIENGHLNGIHDYECDFSVGGPINAPTFMEVMQVTCYGYCIVYGYDDIVVQNPGDPGNPQGQPNPFAVQQSGRYDWVYVNNKKCNNTCCIKEVRYCWDSINERWFRRWSVKELPPEPGCANNSTPFEICVPPPRLFPRVTVITNYEYFPCAQSNFCSQFENILQQINLEEL